MFLLENHFFQNLLFLKLRYKDIFLAKKINCFDIASVEETTEKDEGGSWWQSWSKSIVDTVKEKARNTFENNCSLNEAFSSTYVALMNHTIVLLRIIYKH